MLGYQPQSAWFTERAMEAFAVFLTALSGIREGAGTTEDFIEEAPRSLRGVRMAMRELKKEMNT